MPVWPPEMIFIRALSFQHASESSEHDAGYRLAREAIELAQDLTAGWVRAAASRPPMTMSSFARSDLASWQRVPRLGGQRHEARVMPLKVVVLMHTKPPCLCVGAQMRRCFECRVFHLDSDVSKATSSATVPSSSEALWGDPLGVSQLGIDLTRLRNSAYFNPLILMTVPTRSPVR